MENKRLPYLCDDDICTGCLACVNSCYSGALTITTSAEGYYRPFLNKGGCVGCFLCEKSCPVLNPPPRNNPESIRAYAAWHLDDSIRVSSSSGGAFTAFADSILTRGGIVYGAAWSENLLIEHIGVTKQDDLGRLRLSKYAQSCVGDSLRAIIDHLTDGKEVLFIGTPCQVAGLKRFLRKDYDNLTLIDFICHGVPSILFLQTYIEWLETSVGRVVHIDFRDKRKGWYDNLRVIKNQKGEETVLRGKEDCYWVAFNDNSSLQQSCYQCAFQGFPRVSDITIADFWGIGQKVPFGHKDDIEKGVSLVVVNNAKGGKVLNEAKSSLFLEERSIEEAIGGNLTSVHSCSKPKSRDTIYHDLKVLPFDVFRKKYMSTTIKQEMVKFFRERMPSRFVKYIRLLNQK